MVTVVHVKDDFTVYIGRGSGGCHMLNTPIGKKGWLGNPFSVGDFGLGPCIEKFREAFYSRLRDDAKFRQAVLKIEPDDVLACFCKPKACHGDVIAEYLNFANQQ